MSSCFYPHKIVQWKFTLAGKRTGRQHEVREERAGRQETREREEEEKMQKNEMCHYE